MFDRHPADPLLGLSQRQPPSNVQAEQHLLGALLANNKAYDLVSAFLLPEHFAEPINGRIYQAVARRIEAGRLADAVTLKDGFENSETLSEVGGTAYLAQLLAAMVGIIHAGEYGHAIQQAWMRREVINVGESLVNGAFSGATPPLELCQVNAAVLDKIGATKPGLGSVTMDVAVTAALKLSARAFEKGGYVGYRTGFRQLDRMLRGVEGGAVYCVAARPGMGKTSAALQLARGIAEAERLPVMFRSLEMSAEQLLMRQISMETGISLDIIRSGAWKESDAPASWTRSIGEAAVNIGKLPILINDQGDQTVEQIAAEARVIKRKHGKIGAVIIDYLQIMKPPRGSEKFGLTEATTALSNCLKIAAKQLDCPFIVLSQLNRDCERREDKRPQLSDLRQSGAIEQDAKSVIALYRHEYYVEKAKPFRDTQISNSDFQNKMQDWHNAMSACVGRAEWIILKQRNGPVGTIEMQWDSQRTSFMEPQI